MSGIYGVGSPGTIGGASGGFVLGYNTITTTTQQVVGADPQRKKLTFHNPGTVDIFVAQTVLETTGSDVPFTLTTGSLGGAWLVFANGGVLIVENECQKPWQAISRSGTGSLTVVASRA